MPRPPLTDHRAMHPDFTIGFCIALERCAQEARCIQCGEATLVFRASSARDQPAGAARHRCC